MATELQSTHNTITPQGFRPARVAFKNNMYEESSSPEGLFQSYMSACTSIYSIQSNESPPTYDTTNFGHATPTAQAWKSPIPVPTIVKTKTSATLLTPITQDELDHVTMENKCLTSEIAELREEMQQWSLRRTAQDQPAPPPSSLQPPPIDYTSIVTTVIQTLKTQNLLPQPTEPLASTSASAPTSSGL
ncbi:hypothetical protein ACA910_004233 [Epithemia clementina (nom. ined.)]